MQEKKRFQEWCNAVKNEECHNASRNKDFNQSFCGLKRDYELKNYVSKKKERWKTIISSLVLGTLQNPQLKALGSSYKKNTVSGWGKNSVGTSAKSVNFPLIFACFLQYFCTIFKSLPPPPPLFQGGGGTFNPQLR